MRLKSIILYALVPLALANPIALPQPETAGLPGADLLGKLPLPEPVQGLVATILALVEGILKSLTGGPLGGLTAALPIPLPLPLPGLSDPPAAGGGSKPGSLPGLPGLPLKKPTT
ncbi:hypothetical protein B0O99DRAFT_597957 [Bisporella sp. PMI_857]|nr:hypothetical protein B0O99DRAFT_597957 [Bisporella sp. PMI_857]